MKKREGNTPDDFRLDLFLSTCMLCVIIAVTIKFYFAGDVRRVVGPRTPEPVPPYSPEPTFSPVEEEPESRTPSPPPLPPSQPTRFVANTPAVIYFILLNVNSVVSLIVVINVFILIVDRIPRNTGNKFRHRRARVIFVQYF